MSDRSRTVGNFSFDKEGLKRGVPYESKLGIKIGDLLLSSFLLYVIKRSVNGHNSRKSSQKKKGPFLSYERRSVIHPQWRLSCPLISQVLRDRVGGLQK